MAPRRIKSYFTNDELCRLKAAFDLACDELGLTEADPASRERLAVLIFEVAGAGVLDCTLVKTSAIMLFGYRAERPVAVTAHEVLSQPAVPIITDQPAALVARGP